MQLPKMSTKEVAQLRDKLCQDLTAIGLFPITPKEGKPDITIQIRPYSKSYYGRFVPKSNKMFIYCYFDLNGITKYSYRHLLKTAIHEGVHALQRNDPKFIRVKGVMHNAEFHSLNEEYTKIAMALKLFDYEWGKL